MKSILIVKNKNRGKEISINCITFPGGEINVSVDIKELIKFVGSTITITAWLKDSDGLIALAQLKSIFDDYGVREINLVMGYFPYARQDRICNVGESLAIKVFANIINSLNFSNVTIFDPHSDVTPALIDRVRVIGKLNIIRSIENNFDCFVAPDAGATKEVQKLASYFEVEFIQGMKERNTKTGEISDFKYYGDVEGKKLLIVDDICDGGGTFIGLAESLKKGNPKGISLYITHGIFTKGFIVLAQHFDKIYTTNSFHEALCLSDNEKLECIYKI